MVYGIVYFPIFLLAYVLSCIFPQNYIITKYVIFGVIQQYCNSEILLPFLRKWQA